MNAIVPIHCSVVSLFEKESQRALVETGIGRWALGTRIQVKIVFRAEKRTGQRFLLVVVVARFGEAFFFNKLEAVPQMTRIPFPSFFWDLEKEQHCRKANVDRYTDSWTWKRRKQQQPEKQQQQQNCRKADVRTASSK